MQRRDKLDMVNIAQRIEAGSKSGITGTTPVMPTRTRKSNNVSVQPEMKKAVTEVDSA